MGASLGMLGNFGTSKIQSKLMDKIYEKFEGARNFEEFHVKFLLACSEFNSAMLGVHYKVQKTILSEEHFKKWNEAANSEEKKTIFIELLTNNITVVSPDDFVVTVGVVAPPAAMMLKRTGINFPAVKKFKLHMVPDFIFVPFVTVGAIMVSKLLRQKPNASFA